MMDMKIELTNKQGNNTMKLTEAEIDLIQLLIEDKLEEIYNGPEGLEIYWNTEMMKRLLKKIDESYDKI
jgi:hypothetical protein